MEQIVLALEAPPTLRVKGHKGTLHWGSSIVLPSDMSKYVLQKVDQDWVVSPVARPTSCSTSNFAYYACAN